MDPTRWERIEALCDAALEHEPAQRAAFLEQACAGDAGLRREVRSLLEAIERDPDFLENPLVDLHGFAAPDPPDDAPLPAAIGPWRIIQSLGRGGMGEVLLATRELEDVQQTVALKVIRRGRDTGDVLQRFRLERRILASLDHPNIARLIDAGATADGRPYFVMEHVDGVPLNEYCDRERLTVRDRLTLFSTICGAVQYAHRNLVVHRDLKPGNILITAQGIPKLLDFGIGKVLARTGALGSLVETRAELRLLTPGYAAPEQLTGGPVTTATDVYALGVLLYELLTGRHPFVTGDESLEQLERAVLETDPPRPSVAVSRIESPPPARANARAASSPGQISERRATDPRTLRRRLSGDLDTIVLKALCKEPEHRYPSVAAMAEDIQRHLNGLPISARPATLRYRARKFVGRHAAGVAVTAVAAVALIAITALTLVQSRRVAAESARVTRERDKLLEVRGFLMEMFGASGADQAVGDTVTARQLLDLQASKLDELYGARPELKAEMLEVLADGYDRLGLLPAAEPLAQQALELRRSIHGAASIDVASAMNTYGWILHEAGRTAEAEPLVRDAAAIRRAAGPAFQLDLARSLNDLGVILTAQSRYGDAIAVLTEALDIRMTALGENHRAVGITANNLAAAHYFLSDLDNAVRVQELAVRSLRASVGSDHQRSVVALNNLAAFKVALGDLQGAEADYRQLLAVQTRIQGGSHPVTARVMLSFAQVLSDRAEAGDPVARAEAERMFREAAAVFEARFRPDHPQVSHALNGLSRTLVQANDLGQALEVQQRAVAIAGAALGEGNRETARFRARLAIIRWRLGDMAEAHRLLRGAVDTLQRVVGPDNVETARARFQLCDLLVARATYDEALPECAEAARVLRGAPRGQRGALNMTRLRLAQTHAALDDRVAADSVLAEVRAAVANGEVGPAVRVLLDSLETAFARRGR